MRWSRARRPPRSKRALRGVQTAGPAPAASRLAVVRGQTVFNTKPIAISGVAGLKGQTFSNGVTVPGSFTGTCTICHDAPNAGDHSVKAPLDIGIADPAQAPYLPVYTLRNLATRETIRERLETERTGVSSPLSPETPE